MPGVLRRGASGLSLEPRALATLASALEGCEDAEQLLACAGSALAWRAALRELWFFDPTEQVLHARVAGVLPIEPRPLSSLEPGAAALVRAGCEAPGVCLLEGETVDGAGEAAKVRLLAVPLRRGERLLGMLGLLSVRADAFLPALVEELAALSAPLAGGVERVQLAVRERGVRAALREAHAQMAVANLAAAVAHEIRNPLAAMTHAITLLGTNPALGNEDHELVEIVLEELGRVSRIATDFLSFAKPSAGRFVPVRVEALLDDVVTLLRRDPRACGSVAFTTHIEASLPAVRLDPDKIRQVLWNLGLNAVQAFPRPENVSVRARALCVEGRDGVCVEVRDDGPGIPVALRARMFEPFETTRENGTGLGLALAKHSLELHQGWIALEEAPGGGTCVRFWLPTDGPDAALLAGGPDAALRAQGRDAASRGGE